MSAFKLGRALLVLLLAVIIAAGAPPSKIFSIAPAYDHEHRNVYSTYTYNLHIAHYESASPCGIIWTLMAINGSATDFPRLVAAKGGEGHHRMMSVAYEVLRSAARVKHALQTHSDIPPLCQQKPLELALFADRGIMNAYTEVLSAASCIFDRVTYFDDLPLSNITAMHNRMHSSGPHDTIQRLPPRVNSMKLIALLSSPYQYTMYLDGDTAPCKAFQDYSFSLLAQSDIFTTLNPFGYQSTNGKPLYPGAPNHVDYKGYVEPNGGVIGFQRNERTHRLLIRALELIPFFNQLGFDQDQAYLRHALFEETRLHGLRQNIQPMRKFCRFGWKCDRNTCAQGCAVIHQRNCLNYGVNASFTVPAVHTKDTRSQIYSSPVSNSPVAPGSCSDIVATVENKAVYHAWHYDKAHKKNKGPMVKTKKGRNAKIGRGG